MVEEVEKEAETVKKLLSESKKASKGFIDSEEVVHIKVDNSLDNNVTPSSGTGPIKRIQVEGLTAEEVKTLKAKLVKKDALNITGV